MKPWPIGTLTDPQAPLGRYVPAAWAAATIPALIVTGLITALLPPEMAEAIDEAVLPGDIPFGVNVFAVVVFAPLAETLLMAAGFGVMGALKVPPLAQALVQSVVWGIAHGLIAPLWAVGPAWLFFVFSIIWLTQAERSWIRAFLVVSLVHALNNALAITPYAVEKLS